MDKSVPPVFTALAVSVSDSVATVQLNRPEAANAMNEAMWQELRQAFQWLDTAASVRVVVLVATGKVFCSGIDFAMLAGIQQRIGPSGSARSREALRRIILDLQDCLSAIEQCSKPVLAAVHGACIGGGLDLICCCDMRYASAEASFSVREIDIGMVADVGTLQRLPGFVGEGLARELAYTGRDVPAAEAASIGLVNRVCGSQEELLAFVQGLAGQIAAKSPLATRGIKQVMNYSRDHSVADGLNFVATWNAALLMSEDLAEAVKARQERRPPRFAD